MSNEWKILSLTILLIGLMLGGVGCRSTAGNQQAEPISVSCHAFYRDSQAEALGPESTLTFSRHGDRQIAQFEMLEFSAQYDDDRFEGRSLIIAINAADSGQQVARQLYQLDSQQGTSNQFMGGHGFSGLAYVYHPTTDAELQYFCDVQSAQP